MPNGMQGNSTEFEPFLAPSLQHHDNTSDIELGQQINYSDADDTVEYGENQHDPHSSGASSPQSIPTRQAPVKRPRFNGDGYDNRADRTNTTTVSTFWRRWLPASLSPSRSASSVHGRASNTWFDNTCFGRTSSTLEGSSRGRSGCVRLVLRSFTWSLMFLGTVQFLALVIGIATALFPDKFARLYRNRQDGDKVSRWPTDFSADILPVRCHSHNDYWRKVPVYSALNAGCTGIEADVWLHNDELYVGHAESSLTPARTLKSLYVEPLLNILNKQNPVTDFQPVLRTPRNGVFDTNAEQSLVLLIDFKTNGDTLWPVVREHLEPLRANSYLTCFNGSTLIQRAVTVVATGNAPFHRVIANSTYRDVFFDAPLSEMAKLVSDDSSSTPSDATIPAPPDPYDPTLEQEYLKLSSSDIDNSGTDTNTNITGSDTETQDKDRGQGYSGTHIPPDPRIYTRYNSYYASTSLQQTLLLPPPDQGQKGSTPFPYFTTTHRTQLTNQIDGAHRQGLQVRYWDVPAWPVSWRHYLWRELVKMGIDYLNVDDLDDATHGEWLSVGGFGKLIWGSGLW